MALQIEEKWVPPEDFDPLSVQQLRLLLQQIPDGEEVLVFISREIEQDGDLDGEGHAYIDCIDYRRIEKPAVSVAYTSDDVPILVFAFAERGDNETRAAAAVEAEMRRRRESIEGAEREQRRRLAEIESERRSLEDQMRRNRESLDRARKGQLW